MTRKTLFDNTVSGLSALYPEQEARAIAFVLFEEYLGLSRQDVFLLPDEPAGDASLLENASKELLTGRPLQYVTGKAWFADMEFDVKEGVLIPRPETEELVMWIVSKNKNKPGLQIIDIGTGSGCVAISLAKALPGCKVSAIDISEAAIETARHNAIKLGANVRFSQLDILKNKPEGKFDIIVSNPPYVRESERKQMRANVLNFEPGIALFVKDSDPLLFYRKIAEAARGSLNAGGELYFEINEALGKETVEMLRGIGFSDVELRKDIFDRDRMIRAVWK